MDVPADGFVRMETRDLGVGNIGTMGGMSWGGKKMSLERGWLSAALGHFVVQWHLQRGTEASRSFVLVCRLGGKLSRSRVPRRGGAEEEGGSVTEFLVKRYQHHCIEENCGDRESRARCQ